MSEQAGYRAGVEGFHAGFGYVIDNGIRSGNLTGWPVFWLVLVKEFHFGWGLYQIRSEEAAQRVRGGKGDG